MGYYEYFYLGLIRSYFDLVVFSMGSVAGAPLGGIEYSKFKKLMKGLILKDGLIITMPLKWKKEYEKASIESLTTMPGPVWPKLKRNFKNFPYNSRVRTSLKKYPALCKFYSPATLGCAGVRLTRLYNKIFKEDQLNLAWHKIDQIILGGDKWWKSWYDQVKERAGVNGELHITPKEEASLITYRVFQRILPIIREFKKGDLESFIDEYRFVFKKKGINTEIALKKWCGDIPTDAVYYAQRNLDWYFKEMLGNEVRGADLVKASTRTEMREKEINGENFSFLLPNDLIKETGLSSDTITRWIDKTLKSGDLEKGKDVIHATYRGYKNTRHILNPEKVKSILPKPSKEGTITSSKAAEYLGITKKTLFKWEKEGKIKPTRDQRNYRVYTEEDLKRLNEPGVAEVPVITFDKSDPRMKTLEEEEGVSIEELFKRYDATTVDDLIDKINQGEIFKDTEIYF